MVLKNQPMTPTATYLAEENRLQEESQMEKPQEPDPGSYLPCEYESYNNALSRYKDKLREYNAHLATLRKIPCSPEPGFKDGEKYVEGVDYEVLSMCIGNGCYFGIDYPCEGCDKRAFPLVPVSEDELWEEFLQSVFDATGLNIANYPAGLKLLKSKYSLTKR